jgi:hypothetical protein
VQLARQASTVLIRASASEYAGARVRRLSCSISHVPLHAGNPWEPSLDKIYMIDKITFSLLAHPVNPVNWVFSSCEFAGKAIHGLIHHCLPPDFFVIFVFFVVK